MMLALSQHRDPQLGLDTHLGALPPSPSPVPLPASRLPVVGRGFLKCKVLRGSPVNLLTGEVVMEQVDGVLPGRIPLEWKRVYRSGSRRRGACGVGWECPADARLELNAGDGSVLFMHPSEGPALFPALPAVPGPDGAVLELMDGAVLTDDGGEWRVRTKEDRVYHFPKQDLRRGEGGALECGLALIADLWGNWLEYERRDGRLQVLRTSSGRELQVDQHDGLIVRLRVSVPETGVARELVDYRQDSEGDLTEVRDALGQPCRYAYEAHHLVRHSKRCGLSFHFDYERSGPAWKVLQTRGDGGLYERRFAWGPGGRETRVTDSLGHVSVIQCDERGLPVLEIDPLGGRTLFEYDQAGRTTALVDPENHRSAFTYDERGNLLRLQRPDGSCESFDYDGCNKPVRSTDAGGAVWERRWDARGAMLELRSPLGAVTRYEYDNLGQPVRVLHPGGAETRLAHDSQGQVVAVIDAFGQARRLERDALGQVLASTDALGRTTRYAYDLKGRLTEVWLAGGAPAIYRYDAEDQLCEYVDELGASTRFEYAGLGLLARQWLPDGQAIAYHYDTEARLLGVDNPRGEAWRFRRDALGRVVEETDYWGQTTRWRWSIAGHLRERFDPMGGSVRCETDALGRITRTLASGPAAAEPAFEERFEFDAAGRLLACANPHIEIRRRFDVEGRLLEERQGDFVLRQRFDTRGNRIRRETSTGRGVTFAYDPLDRLVALKVDGQAPVQLSWDTAGRLRSERLGTVLQRRYRHDSEGRVTEQELVGPSGRLASTRYHRDARGELVQRVDTDAGVERYRYDSLGQIVEQLDPRGQVSRFLRDAAGDLLRTEVIEAPGRRVAGEGGQADAAWSREGRYAGTFYRYDRAGRLVWREDRRRATRLVWDSQHRLVGSETGARRCRYGYDPLGRRIFKDHGERRTRYHWDGDVLLAEARQGASGSAWREWLCYPGSHEPLALLVHPPHETAQAPAAPVRLYFFGNDVNGAPLRVFDVHGKTAWRTGYDALGACRAETLASARQPLRLQGQYEDEETGLYYNLQRYYDPHIGSFISQNPIGLAGGVNPYGWGPNVLAWINPQGLAVRAQHGSQSAGRRKG
ncbi:DUF6531 domain-containing protein [Aquabacterium sp. A7-Y]|uniref:DUF6531 domain-containing protein n=1 Tax=Aquabacterium sp. A7-Y TaxID=1349605 RepID=UPI00223C928B|nr:DUF6531 domain-containing protein [Aquabacterium sp. A7-Y]MCW7539780.1 DUF6531 domain-containing protein [Aquabacterium sp. A7-Y]